MSGYVACGKDIAIPKVRERTLFVDFQETLACCFDSCIFQTQSCRIRVTTDRNQDNVDLYHTAVPIIIIQNDLQVITFFTNRAKSGSMVNNHPVLLKIFGDKIANIVIFKWYYPVRPVQQMNLRLSKIGKNGCKFTSDDTRSNDHHPFRKAFQVKNSI